MVKIEYSQDSNRKKALIQKPKQEKPLWELPNKLYPDLQREGNQVESHFQEQELHYYICPVPLINAIKRVSSKLWYCMETGN